MKISQLIDKYKYCPVCRNSLSHYISIICDNENIWAPAKFLFYKSDGKNLYFKAKFEGFPSDEELKKVSQNGKDLIIDCDNCIIDMPFILMDIRINGYHLFSICDNGLNGMTSTYNVCHYKIICNDIYYQDWSVIGDISENCAYLNCFYNNNNMGYATRMKYDFNLAELTVTNNIIEDELLIGGRNRIDAQKSFPFSEKSYFNLLWNSNYDPDKFYKKIETLTLFS